MGLPEMRAASAVTLAARLGAPATRWERLRPFSQAIDSDAQVLLVAATGGAKSTLVATLTLDSPSLVALDEKDALVLPHARIVHLPAWGSLVTRDQPDAYLRAVRKAIDWRDGETRETSNRVIVRPHVTDIDNFDAHDAIFQAVYERRHTILWVDEITATGATAQRVQPWLRGISARGRTRGVGLWTCTQAPYGLTPTILRRNATYLIFGPIDQEDARDIPREGIDVAVAIPRKSGRFVVYKAGEREPYRLYLPIPPALKAWKAP